MQQDTVWFWAIDWAATGSMLAGIGAAVTAVIVVITYRKAKNELEDWKKRQIFTEKMKISADVMEVFHEIREGVNFVRQADVLYEFETKKAFEYHEIDIDFRKKYNESALVCLYRDYKMENTWSRLRKILYRSKFILGNELYECLMLVFRQRHNIVFSARKLSEIGTIKDKKNLDKHQSRIWKGHFDVIEGMDEDPVDAALDEIQKSLEHVLSPFMKGEFK